MGYHPTNPILVAFTGRRYFLGLGREGLPLFRPSMRFCYFNLGCSSLGVGVCQTRPKLALDSAQQLVSIFTRLLTADSRSNATEKPGFVDLSVGGNVCRRQDWLL